MSYDLVVFCDGGCTANPGDLAVGVVACRPTGELLFEDARRVGRGTSNVAEYRALAHAIFTANLLGARRPLFLTDSALVSQQVNGFWAMRGNEDLKYEHAHCTTALMGFERWTLKHVRREENRRADWLVSGLLGHARTLKKAPEVAAVSSSSDGKPGWSEL
jgi:ribonuclease HI